MPYAICTFRDGDRPIATINDTLILTNAEAIERGFAELEKTHKTPHKIFFKLVYNSHSDLRPGVWININCAELGLEHENVLIQDGLAFRSDEISLMVDIDALFYEWETDTSVLGTIYRSTSDDELRIVEL